MRRHLRLPRALWAQATYVAIWTQTSLTRPNRGRSRRPGDVGVGVVDTIIIVAGFAMVAFVVYLAVKGKVSAWVSKIPSGNDQP